MKACYLAHALTLSLLLLAKLIHFKSLTIACNFACMQLSSSLSGLISLVGYLYHQYTFISSIIPLAPASEA